MKTEGVALTREEPVGTECSTAGRVVSFRRMGNLCFGHIQDATGKLQICLKKGDLPDYKETIKKIQVGCFLSVQGVIFITDAGERTIKAFSVQVLALPKKGFPSSFYGVTDARKRYLETAIDEDAAKNILLRSTVYKSIRGFLGGHNFIEVETPILTPIASGAIARPFVTHHNALGQDLYLRIAPETRLKMMTAGGFDRIFEIGKSFRNEGIDRSHIQEFTSLEWYACYQDYQDNRVLFGQLLERILTDCGFTDLQVPYWDVVLSFKDIPVVKYRDLFAQAGLQSPDEMLPHEADEIFKKEIRPGLIQPIYVEDYPARMSPMAKRKDPDTVEQWQLIVAGWEIVKCYTELTDSDLQRQILLEQASQKEDESMRIDEEFLEAMEYGMPPQSGVGIGLDRLIALLTNKASLKEALFFPLLG